ncbi:hypothetical protein [Chitinimonas sp.]|uniref:hypothetical protein n=1 Tax=Chitinimonas sp. TaxID=1934313 RepID=UPI002F927882
MPVLPLRALALATTLPLLSACSSLLPESKSVEKSAWQSYEDAEAAMNRIQPRRTKLDDLRRMGFDPQTGTNIATLSYADILRRFSAGDGSNVQLDKGVRSCLALPAECSGIEVNASGEYRERIGSFWPDFLNFRREWRTTGWRFNAIILLKSNVVVYRTWGGKPNIDKLDKTNNPLGPLQGMGEHAAEIR